MSRKQFCGSPQRTKHNSPHNDKVFSYALLLISAVLVLGFASQWSGLSVYDTTASPVSDEGSGTFGVSNYEVATLSSVLTTAVQSFGSVNGTLMQSMTNGLAIYNTSKDNTATTWKTNSSLGWFSDLNSSILGEYLIFNGSKNDIIYVSSSGGVVNISDVEPQTGDMTWTGWFWLNTTVNKTTGYYSKAATSSPGGGYVFQSYNNNTHSLYNMTLRENSTSLVQLIGTAPLLNGGWRHIGITINRTGNVTLYINGSVVNTTIASAINTKNVSGGSSSDFYFGVGYFFSSSEWSNFTGFADEFRVYNRTLSPTEVNDDYTRGLAHLPTNVSARDQTLELTFDNGETTDSSPKNHSAISNGGGGSNPYLSRRNYGNAFPDRAYCIIEASGWEILNASDGKMWMGATTSKGYLDGVSSFTDCYTKNGKMITIGNGNLYVHDFTTDRLSSWNAMGITNWTGGLSRRNLADGWSVAGGYNLTGSKTSYSCNNFTTDIICAIGTSTGIDILNISNMQKLSNSSEMAGSIFLTPDQ